MQNEPDGLEVLSRQECLRLIHGVPIGRVAVIVGDVPVVVPVNFTLLGDDVVFRTAPGTKLLAAVSRSAVSFEVDMADDATHSGWSVLVTGPASEITEPEEQAAARERGLDPWVEGRERYVRICSDVVTGRRVRSAGPRARAPETYFDWGW